MCETPNIFQTLSFYYESNARPGGGADALSTQCFSQSVSTKAERVQSIPQEEKLSLLPSLRSHTSSSPLLHSNTSVNCMHFSFFVLFCFSFGAIVSVLSLNFSSFFAL